MTKRLTLLSCAVLGFLTGYASEPQISVMDRQGTKSSVVRSDVSRINLKPDIIEIIRKNGDKLTFSKETISRILLSDTESGISDIRETDISVSPTMTRDIVRITGIQEPTNFYLFDLNGQIRLSGMCLPNECEISISSLQKGLYLLVFGQNTFKIIKQ